MKPLQGVPVKGAKSELYVVGPARVLPKRDVLLRDAYHDWRVRLRLSTKARKTLFIRV